jgi:predicted cupin superfamily sugar epimerase
MNEAKTLIEELRLSPHPEGGWFRETWRMPAEDEHKREFATAIYFLLEAHQRSHWHKVDAAEVWLWHAGDPLLLSVSPSPHGPARDVRLGADVVAGDRPHYVIGAHEWQSAKALPGTHGYTLLTCMVVPAFRMAGFTLAPPDWYPGREPSPSQGG